MSGAVVPGGVCLVCQAPRPPRFYRYCSEACRMQRTVVRTALRDRAKIKPCPRCGGIKEPGKRRYCEACREALLPVWQRQEYERGKRKGEAAKARRAAEGRSLVRRDLAVEDSMVCARCEQDLPLSQFTWSKHRNRWNSYCQPCQSAYNHENRLAKVYGITVQEYDDLFAVQEGRCAICLCRPRKRRLAVDHDHKTGQVRGLLCTRCNHKLLGAASDSAVILLRAASYLEAPPAVTRMPSSQTTDYIERHVEQMVEEATERHVADPSVPPVAFLEVDGKSVAVMDGETFTGLLRDYERRVGVPLSIVVQESA